MKRPSWDVIVLGLVYVVGLGAAPFVAWGIGSIVDGESPAYGWPFFLACCGIVSVILIGGIAMIRGSVTGLEKPKDEKSRPKGQ